MVPVGYTWLRQTFGLLKSELEHESYLGSRASLTHQKNGRKTRRQQSLGADGFIGYSSVKSVVKNSGS